MGERIERQAAQVGRVTSWDRGASEQRMMQGWIYIVGCGCTGTHKNLKKKTMIAFKFSPYSHPHDKNLRNPLEFSLAPPLAGQRSERASGAVGEERRSSERSEAQSRNPRGVRRSQGIHMQGPTSPCNTSIDCLLQEVSTLMPK